METSVEIPKEGFHGGFCVGFRGVSRPFQSSCPSSQVPHHLCRSVSRNSRASRPFLRLNLVSARFGITPSVVKRISHDRQRTAQARISESVAPNSWSWTPDDAARLISSASSKSLLDGFWWSSQHTSNLPESRRSSQRWYGEEPSTGRWVWWSASNMNASPSATNETPTGQPSPLSIQARAVSRRPGSDPPPRTGSRKFVSRWAR